MKVNIQLFIIVCDIWVQRAYSFKILKQLWILRTCLTWKAVIEVESWLSCLYQTICIRYILYFIFMSSRVPKGQEVNQGLQWVYLHLYLFTGDAYMLAWFEIIYWQILFKICHVIGSTWSTWPKSKFSWFCLLYLHILH